MAQHLFTALHKRAAVIGRIEYHSVRCQRPIQTYHLRFQSTVLALVVRVLKLIFGLAMMEDA